MVDTRIRYLRKIKAEQGLGYDQLAQGIGVSFMSVYRWLKKGALPRNHLVIKAVDKFLERHGYLPEKKAGQVRHKVLVKQ